MLITLSIIGAAPNAISVHVAIMRICLATIATCTNGREITPDMGSTVVKIVTTMTRDKQELANNSPKMAVISRNPNPHMDCSTSSMRNISGAFKAP